MEDGGDAAFGKVAVLGGTFVFAFFNFCYDEVVFSNENSRIFLVLAPLVHITNQTVPLTVQIYIKRPLIIFHVLLVECRFDLQIK